MINPFWQGCGTWSARADGRSIGLLVRLRKPFAQNVLDQLVALQVSKVVIRHHGEPHLTHRILPDGNPFEVAMAPWLCLQNSLDCGDFGFVKGKPAHTYGESEREKCPLQNVQPAVWAKVGTDRFEPICGWHGCTQLRELEP